MEGLSLLLAFSAGLLSFLSPCVLPLVPAYVFYLTGEKVNNFDEKKSKYNILFRAMGFVLGFTLIFILTQVSISLIGNLLTVNKEIFRRIAGIIVIVLGLHIAGLFKIKALYSEKKLFEFGGKVGGLGSIFLGAAFAAGWTPCIGPILSSILLYANSMETASRGLLLLVLYSLGLGIPFILAALLIDSLEKYLKVFSRYLPVVSVISGSFVIIMGIIIYLGKVNILSSYFNFAR